MSPTDLTDEIGGGVIQAGAEETTRVFATEYGGLFTGLLVSVTATMMGCLLGS